MDKAIVNVINQMSEVLSIGQLRRLQQVLIENLIDNKDMDEELRDNSYYVDLFISTKLLEGKSHKTMESYSSTINRVLAY